MVIVVCNKAKEYGCTIDDCYHAVPHEEYDECKAECRIIDDDNIECIEV